MNPKCCGQNAKWVENVPGKGYYFCGDCRKEVSESPANSVVDASDPYLLSQEEIDKLMADMYLTTT